MEHFCAAFVSVASSSRVFHPSWIELTIPTLTGMRVTSPFALSMLQSFLLLQPSSWMKSLLSPFVSLLTSAKLKRRRSMRDSDLVDAFSSLLDCAMSDSAPDIVPRPLRALLGSLWHTSMRLKLTRDDAVEIVAECYFQRILYPALLVPDQYGLLDSTSTTPLRPLAKQVLMAAAKCMTACVCKVDMSATVYACVDKLSKSYWGKMTAFVEKMVTDAKNWEEYVQFPKEVVLQPICDAELGGLLASLSDSGLSSKTAEMDELLKLLPPIQYELERRRGIVAVVNEEKDFTMRVDGVTFWLRQLDYGLMIEGTAMRMMNEWLKKVNQLRAVLRISLNKRTHPSQWNGKISDIVAEADFSVFSEFGNILLRNLPIVANSVDGSLERALVTYKRDTSRDALRDLVAVLLHSKTLLTRLGRVPLSKDEEENVALAAVLEKAHACFNSNVAADCLEMVRLHQMQCSIVTGWNAFPRELLEGTGMVKPGRRQVHYGRISVISPSTFKSAKFAMLLSDALVLLQIHSVNQFDGPSSAIERESVFGSGNAFSKAKLPAPSERKRRSSTSISGKAKDDVSFRLVKCINLVGGQVRLRPDKHAFIVSDKTGSSCEISVNAAHTMEWIHAWAKVDKMEHSQTPTSNDSSAVSSPRTPRTPRTPHTDTASSDDDDIDEVDALMALGMYDTAVIKPEEAPSESDAAFNSMVGQMRRRDGKQRMSLQELFIPPPGMVHKAWKDSIRMMKHEEAPEDEVMESPAPQRHAQGKEIPKNDEEPTEEMQLRALIANMRCTLRYWSEDM